MNIWDSVQRSLEKATQEATRIARTQRLRSTIDGLTRQIHTQEDDLIVRAMDVFSAGQLIQSELIPICQELTRLQQQLEQTRQELAQIQSQGIQPPASGTIAQSPASPYSSGADLPPTVDAPPPPPEYRPFATMPVPPPPPPPGVDPITLSSFDTVRGTAPDNEKLPCKQCGVELIPGEAYCHNCGSAVQGRNASYQPTVRSTTEAEQETMRAATNEDTPSASVTERATIHNDPSSSTTKETNEAGLLSTQSNEQGGD
jgi:hypothetical protein